MLRRTFLALATMAGVATGSASFADTHSKDIVDTAIGAGSFGTLVAAVDAAGLVETLKGEGPFTVTPPSVMIVTSPPWTVVAIMLLLRSPLMTLPGTT